MWEQAGTAEQQVGKLASQREALALDGLLDLRSVCLRETCSFCFGRILERFAKVDQGRRQ